jgi:hypothetical protein
MDAWAGGGGRASKGRGGGQWLAAALAAALLTGCAGVSVCVDGADGGARHQLILGLGLVSLPGAAGGEGATASRTTAVGLSVTAEPNARLVIGYLSSTTVAVPDGAEDVRIEVSQRPAGPLRVDAARVAVGRGRF